jgi:hypothetical protein
MQDAFQLLLRLKINHRSGIGELNKVVFVGHVAYAIPCARRPFVAQQLIEGEE